MANYSADAHEAQMKLLRRLLMSATAKFNELEKATGLTSDHANFHIKKLIAAGFVEHVPKSYGEYQLTVVGKEYANRMDTDEHVMEKQPKLSVVIMLENDRGEFLTQQRLKHPYYGYWGHITGKIRWGETMLEAAARELREESGLFADLTVRGFVHKLDYDEQNQLLEDKYLCLVHGTNPTGDLIVDMEGHHNEWMSPADYEKTDKNYGSLEHVHELLRSASPFIYERKYHYPTDDY